MVQPQLRGREIEKIGFYPYTIFSHIYLFERENEQWGGVDTEREGEAGSMWGWIPGLGTHDLSRSQPLN